MLTKIIFLYIYKHQSPFLIKKTEDVVVFFMDTNLTLVNFCCGLEKVNASYLVINYIAAILVH